MASALYCTDTVKSVVVLKILKDTSTFPDNEKQCGGVSVNYAQTTNLAPIVGEIGRLNYYPLRKYHSFSTSKRSDFPLICLQTKNSNNKKEIYIWLIAKFFWESPHFNVFGIQQPVHLGTIISASQITTATTIGTTTTSKLVERKKLFP